MSKRILISGLILIFIIAAVFQRHSKLYFSGYTDTLYLYLSSPSQGYFKQKFVSKGEHFKKHQLLYELEAMPDEANYQTALFQYRQAKNILKDLKRPRRQPEIAAIKFQIHQIDESIARTKKHYDRLLLLKDKQYVDVDTLYTNEKMVEELKYQKKQLEENLKLSQMGARIDQIKAQNQVKKSSYFHLQELKWYLQHKQASAPADGYVFDIFYSIGELITANKPVMSVVLPENNYIEFFVSAHDVSKIFLHQTVEYQYFGDNKWFAAEINYISQTAEYMPPVLYTQQHQDELVFRIRAKPANQNIFILGQPIEVRL